MLSKRMITTACAAAILTTMSATPARAQMTQDARTEFTFNQPVELPGPEASDEAELRFLETPAGQPAAVKTWWYFGVRTGREFIYPKSQARRLARAANQTVLTTQAEAVTNDQMKTADLAYVAPSGQETNLTDDQLVDATANTPPVGASADTMAARAPVQEGTMAANTSTRTRLPRTSTPLAGIGLMGLMSLRSAAAIRFRR
ncbi:MAG: hypothetical protein EXQ55_05220 [Acidobacteria bacterium]|nr:hypothetical protein [Acidobacteriota bacterium]